MQTTAIQAHDRQEPEHEQIFLQSWQNRDVYETPYPHFLMKNVFPTRTIDAVLALPIEAHHLDYNLGSREEHNALRRYFTPDLIAKHQCAQDIADVFLSPGVIQTLEKAHNISLKNSLLRIEHTTDTEKFWLKPHTDLGVKLFTMLLYLSKDPTSAFWGTDIYQDEQTHVKTVPFKSNTAVYFIPADDTWHGFEPRSIRGVRQTLIINYVTQEWRNRNELVHPTQPVY